MQQARVALITGSATGLGRRTAIEFAKQGVHVAVNYQNSRKDAEALADEITSLYGAQALPVQGDISQYADAKRIVEEAFSRFGQIDFLVNNAGPYIAERKAMADYSLEEWHQMINGNLNSVFYLCRETIPKMRERRFGRIVNIGFERAETAPAWPYRSAFAAAKVGLVALTKTLAIEEAQHGITVNMVCPGDITGEWKEAAIERGQQASDPSTPVGRRGTGGDIARTILFLCAEESDYLTGSVISVTGAKDVIGKYEREQER